MTCLGSFLELSSNHGMPRASGEARIQSRIKQAEPGQGHAGPTDETEASVMEQVKDAIIAGVEARLKHRPISSLPDRHAWRPSE